MPEKIDKDALFIAFLSGNASESEKDQVYSLLAENNKNRILIAELSQIWDAAGILDDIVVETDRRFRKLLSRIRKSQKTPLNVATLLKYAAVFVFALILGISISHYFPDNRLNNQLYTTTDTRIVSPIGSKTNLVLADGTEVWLNASSTLSYSSRFGNLPERKVLLEGEAYFKVKENKKKPFIVMAHSTEIRALGTSFNVKAYLNESEIVATLVEGKISVRTPGQKVEEFLLKPNESIKICRKESELSAINVLKNKSLDWISTTPDEESSVEEVILSKGVNTELHTSWKDTRWIFENEELRYLSKKLERRYAVTVQFKDNTIADIRFTGTLMEESLEQVLEVISFAAPIKYRVDGANVFLEKK